MHLPRAFPKRSSAEWPFFAWTRLDVVDKLGNRLDSTNRRQPATIALKSRPTPSDYDGASVFPASVELGRLATIGLTGGSRLPGDRSATGCSVNDDGGALLQRRTPRFARGARSSVCLDMVERCPGRFRGRAATRSVSFDERRWLSEQEVRVGSWWLRVGGGRGPGSSTDPFQSSGAPRRPAGRADRVVRQRLARRPNRLHRSRRQRALRFRLPPKRDRARPPASQFHLRLVLY